MGWLFEEKDIRTRSRLDLVIEKIEFNEPPRSAKVIYASQRGRVIYCAVHAVNTETGLDVVYGTVVLTSIDNRSWCNFGTKFMDETMGPNYYDAPVKLISLLSPTDNEYALNWRNRCIMNAEKSKCRRNLGQHLRSLPENTILQLNDGRNTMVQVWTIHGKRIYRIIDRWARIPVKYILNSGFTVIGKE